MNRKKLFVAALVVAAAIPLGGRTTDTPLQEAAVAWDRGDYATALKTYLQILDSPDAETAIEPIALQTGELYRTTELTSDGDVPIFAPDGRHVAYESGAGLSRRTRVVRVADAPRVAVELPGFGASFSIDGSKIAYLRVPTSGAATAAQAALDAAAPGDRLQRSNALNQIINAEARVDDPRPGERHRLIGRYRIASRHRVDDDRALDRRQRVDAGRKPGSGLRARGRTPAGCPHDR